MVRKCAGRCIIANRFWVLESGTWDASDTTHWSTTTGGAGGASVPGSGDAVIFNELSAPLGGTCTVNTTVTVQSITMGAFTGTLDFSANNNNVTMQSCSVTGTGVRTLNMGNGTWILTTFNASVWDASVVTNFTLNANGSTLSFIPSSATPTGSINFLSGGKAYNVVTHSGVTNQQIFSIQGAPTIATLTIAAPANVTFAQSTTTTITNAPAWIGTATNQFFIGSSSTTGVATIVLNAAGGTAQWAAIRGLTVTTNALTATNSFDLKGNTLITIMPPAIGGGGARIVNG